MNPPPPFPRIPLLLRGDGADADDLALTPADARVWFGQDVVVEEKLDGANVSIWRDDHGRFQVAGRGGPGAMDRAGQLGRLRAWVAAHQDPLAALLKQGGVLYGEWLYLQHTLHYDRLPDLLCVIDLCSANGQALDSASRERRCAGVGLWSAPRVFEGHLYGEADLDALSLRSTARVGPMEGLVLRQEREGRLIDRCKWLRPGFRRLSDADWARGRPKNVRQADTLR